ncbi:MAG TPA: 3-methyl-2-oxobutanoate hydroxymethyltransferase [Vicinamibacterales bacterium]
MTVPELRARKTQPEGKIACLTAYDFPTAVLLDRAGVDLILVGDSLGMVVQGRDDTLSVTLDEVLYHLRTVRRAVRRALVVADLPYGSYHVSGDEMMRAALRLIKEGGAEAIKIEGGDRRRDAIHRLVEADIPVMGHIGLTPQSVHALGGFTVQGRSEEAAQQLLRDAHAVEEAGAFAIVLESIPRELAARITGELRIPTIGIGAGPDCDGQVLVFHDLVGLTINGAPKFAREYAQLGTEIVRAATAYINDVRNGSFPADSESFHLPAALGDRTLARR